MKDSIEYLATPSRLGELYVAASEQGLCRVAWYTSEMAFTEELADDWKRQVRRADYGESRLLGAGCQQLTEYLDGSRKEFDLPLDLSRQSAFQSTVLTALLRVPRGEVVSYGELATLAGYPRAARAVGSAMRGNPLPIIIPCHRVVLSSGELGGFGGRPDLKRQLLAIEGWGNEP